MTAGREFDAPPREEWHNTVVDQVKCRDLVRFLANDEKDRIKKLDKLGDVVPPAVLSHCDRVWIVRVVARLTGVIVLEQPTVF